MRDSSSSLPLGLVLVLAHLLGSAAVPVVRSEPPTEVSAAGNALVVCSQPGPLGGIKIPADTCEVANDCLEAGSARIVRASWWGGYLDWQVGWPHVTRFDVRFYDNVSCSPSSLIAEYLSAEPDTTHLGDCQDGFPCFRYDLDVDVEVGPERFWMSVKRTEAAPERYQPRWGRLGDEVLVPDGCPSAVRCGPGVGWDPLPPFPEWDVSQEYLVIQPTATDAATWGSVKSVYR